MRRSNHRTWRLVAGLVVASVMPGCRGGGEPPAARHGDRPSGGTAQAPIEVQQVGDASRPGARRLTSVDHRVVAAVSRFGFTLFDALEPSGGSRGVLVSPLATYGGILALHHAAGGETRAGLATILHVAAAGDSVTETAVADLWRGLPGTIPDLVLRQALWLPPGARSDSAFAGWAAANALDVRSVARARAAGAVDEWFGWSEGSGPARSAADGRGMLLTSVASLTWRWPEALDAHDGVGTFRGPAGSATVPVATIRGRFPSLENDAVRAIRLPFAAPTLGLYVVIPSDPGGLAELVEGLTFDRWAGWMSMSEEHDLVVTLPRFAVRDRRALDGALGRMGAGFLADSTRVDFPGVTDSPAGLFVSGVEHGAALDVPTPARVAAAGEATPRRGGDTFVVDRPFLVVVRDDVTAAVLLIGTVVEAER